MMRPNSEDGFFGRVRRLILYDDRIMYRYCLRYWKILCSYASERAGISRDASPDPSARGGLTVSCGKRKRADRHPATGSVTERKSGGQLVLAPCSATANSP